MLDSNILLEFMAAVWYRRWGMDTGRQSNESQTENFERQSHPTWELRGQAAQLTDCLMSQRAKIPPH